MLFKEIIPAYCENHTKPINTLGKQNELLIVKAGGTYSDHWVVHSVANYAHTFPCVLQYGS
jgi:hypothetical protein